ncbi:hypothetical protein VZ95_04650 [Elstera litoralis]|uniref:Calcineurin-like phosphoesterase domain-containing protein n=1 Tax=Elstera litoralis TaxID=552518 RepID=A0A0F3IXZ2_9PROT|nr:hypothetical protein VZ95_04650 [Elstera litoralis]
MVAHEGLPLLEEGGALIYAIGDIHGCARELDSLHEQIAADAAHRMGARHRPVTLVYVGDYVDRGPDSAGVIERLLGPAPIGGAERIYLRGNHEDAMLAFLEDAEAGAEWLDYGGLETLKSYGVNPGGGALWRQKLSEGLAAKLPAPHRQFLTSLRDRWSYGGYGFVHAGIRPGLAWDAQKTDDLLWIREPFLSSRTRFDRKIVHGHTITEMPDVRPNRIGIDTGAFHSGILTALVIDGAMEAFLQTIPAPLS